jgi:hypothetical protein
MRRGEFQAANFPNVPNDSLSRYVIYVIDFRFKSCIVRRGLEITLTGSSGGGIEIGLGEISHPVAPVARCRHIWHSIQNRVDRDPTERNRRQSRTQRYLFITTIPQEKRKPGDLPSECQGLEPRFTPPLTLPPREGRCSPHRIHENIGVSMNFCGCVKSCKVL